MGKTWKVYSTWMYFGEEDPKNIRKEDKKFLVGGQIPYFTKLIYVEDEKGNKVDWRYGRPYREKDVLDKLVKEGTSKRYEIHEDELNVGKTFSKTVAGQIHYRLEWCYAFESGFVYVTEIDGEKAKKEGFIPDEQVS